MNVFKDVTLITIGSLLYAFALRSFILPNGLFDNGMAGIGVVVYYLSSFNLSLLFLVLNAPFWILGLKKINRTYGIYTIIAVAELALFVALIELVESRVTIKITDDILIASIFGGVFLGVGTGLIIKRGGSLDGIDTVAILLSKKTSFSIGEVAFAFNILIMFSAGLYFGMPKFFYSIISYFISTKLIDITITGFYSIKNIMIISDYALEISNTLMHDLGKGVTFLSGKGGYTKKNKEVIMVIANRFEIGKIKDISYAIDKNAFIIINDVHEVAGGMVKR